jgi:excisionase family DNA binding protein
MSEKTSFSDETLTREQVQEYLKISRGSLLRRMNDPDSPIPYFKLKRHVLFKKADVEAWLESKRVK